MNYSCDIDIKNDFPGCNDQLRTFLLIVIPLVVLIIICFVVVMVKKIGNGNENKW